MLGAKDPFSRNESESLLHRGREALLHRLRFPEFFVGPLHCGSPSLLDQFHDADVPGSNRHDHQCDQRSLETKSPASRALQAIGVVHPPLSPAMVRGTGLTHSGRRRRNQLERSARRRAERRRAEPPRLHGLRHYDNRETGPLAATTWRPSGPPAGGLKRAGVNLMVVPIPIREK